jgi:HEAT repeat protein
MSENCPKESQQWQIQIHWAIGRLCFVFLMHLTALTACKDAKNETKPSPDKAELRTPRPKGTMIPAPRSPFAEHTTVSGKSAPFAGVFDENDPEADKQVEALLAKVKPTLSVEDANMLINDARHLRSEKLVQLAMAFLQHPDVNVRGYALTLLEGNDSPKVLPAVKAAMNDKESVVRMQALEVLRFVQHPEALPIYREVLNDKEPGVRMTAFVGAVEGDAAFKNETIKTGIASPYEDVARASLAYMEVELSAQTISDFMAGLDNKSQVVRQEAKERLLMLFDQNFTSSTAAKTWWEKNKVLYDENLVRKDASDLIR